ncbi:ciliogenesis-associated TTC17-interacting protein [Prorops nasuta]|uniref:ciliogenesis-associated TTC17-interacting protein n=1 Tax=Prorops nasuta TaxID=863751 RepID=UPI0034D0224C
MNSWNMIVFILFTIMMARSTRLSYSYNYFPYKNAFKHNVINYLHSWHSNVIVQWNNFSIVICLDDAKRESICFREVLLISLSDESSKSTKPIGRYSMSIESFGPESYEFLINAQSSMNFDNFVGGSSVIGSITEKLHCLDEKRRDIKSCRFISEDGNLNEKILHIGLGNKFYHVKAVSSCPCDKTEQTKDIECNVNPTSEAANLFLLRYLAITNFNGKLSLNYITIDGEVKLCDYLCSPAKMMKFITFLLPVYKIERILYNNSEIKQKMTTFLTESGRILKHEWSDTSYFIHINPLINPLKIYKKTIFSIPLKHCWMDDLEMMSKYLDMKSCKKNELRNYLLSHPEIKQLIADYIQTLLVVKPVNILDFTIQHFKVFVKNPDNLEAIFLYEKEEKSFDSFSFHEHDKCDFLGSCTQCSDTEN